VVVGRVANGAAATPWLASSDFGAELTGTLLVHAVCETTPATATPASKAEEPLTNWRRVVVGVVCGRRTGSLFIQEDSLTLGLGAIIVIGNQRYQCPHPQANVLNSSLHANKRRQSSTPPRPQSGERRVACDMSPSYNSLLAEAGLLASFDAAENRV
jgi:hypothetical protein